MYRRIIPEMFTTSNLVFGMCSILATFNGDYFWGSIFIMIALCADGLDGRTARFFGVAGEMGKEMDSLCDLVSFGVAPGFLVFSFCLKDYGILGWVAVIFFAACGMWRLARFNVNAATLHGYFMGLAIPAGGNILATSTLLFLLTGFNPRALGIAYPIIVMIVAYLLVIHVHFSFFKGAGEKIYVGSKVFAVVLFVFILYYGRDAIGAAVLFGLFATYALFGIFNYALALFSRR